MFKLDLLTLEDNIYQSRNLILCLNNKYKGNQW